MVQTRWGTTRFKKTVKLVKTFIQYLIEPYTSITKLYLQENKYKYTRNNTLSES